MTEMNGLEKSSRSKADFFEVLIARGLARNYNIDKDFSKRITILKMIISKFENGYYRIEEQEQRANKAVKELTDFLTKEGINNIKDVEWIGRYHQTEHTLSDIDITLNDNSKIGISLKTVRTGMGTQKNLGYKTLKKYLSINIDKELADMWNNVREGLKKTGDSKLKSISYLPKIEIRKRKRIYPIIEKIGKKYGHPVQIESVKQSINKFNALTDNEKSNFMKLIFGFEDKKRLLNVIAQKDKVIIYWNNEYDSIILGKGLEAKNIGDVSYGIYTNNSLIIRLQASFTNGIGISPYCQRAFLT